MSTVKPIRDPRPCEVCGTTFVSTGYGGGRCCSRRCLRKSQIRPIAERFQKFIGPPNERGCILWTGCCNNRGYGNIGAGGRGGKVLLAHRVSWGIVNGPIPEGLCVLHRCDNPPCVNVAHLFLGTKSENTADMFAKGRGMSGENHRMAVLTAVAVRDIRARYSVDGVTLDQLAAQYGVNWVTIRDAYYGFTWKHV